MPDLVELRLHWIDVLIIFGYLSTLVAIGVYHSRRQSNLEEFFLAGQDMRWLALGMSLTAALNSGLDYLMQPSAIIQYGAVILISNLSWVLLLPWVFYVVVPFYRRLGSITAYEYLEQRFDSRVRTLTAGIFLLWRLGWLSAALYVPSLAISTATGGQVSVSSLIIVIGLVITSYTMLGGIRAVIWSDVIQFCIMFSGLVVTVVVATANIEGGFKTIIAQVFEAGDPAQAQAPLGTSASPLSFFYIPMTVTGFFIAGIVSRTATYTSDQVMVQRFQTAKTVKDARRGLLLLAISDVAWMVALCFVGLALFAFYKAQFGELPAWTKEHPDQVFPYFITQVFPIGLTGLIIAAILAASVSSIDSAINSLTSVAIVDFIERLYMKRQGGDNELTPTDRRYQVLVSRLVTLLFGLAGIGLSLYVSTLGSLLEICNKLVNSFTGPILGIYLLGMFTSRSTSIGVLVGGTIGAIVTMFLAFQAQVYGVLNTWLGAGLNPQAVVSFLWPSMFGFLATVILGYLSSLLIPSTESTSGRRWMWSSIVRTEFID